ncbi:bifunctional (p)ppGpp synthetase/guanosine-3',5'-bis(diphosphate) 3'-pyrophosphohydrolase [bacterium]|nr:bifunctional (p)ppGpp synthetase/guanosine-3',5'-bis(diphosphate) 3'-pyrophosphohydrolase [bacterium]MCB2201716.1 bifunctional (p)ppGpp synthetase/guanosine-3',5'-bis(diphosphate) 3'-pyrophosphohydrolase [bacterium]
MNLAEFIIRIESYNSNIDIPLIRRSFEFSDKAHAGQKRQSGEPYIEHCLEVAFFLAELHMDSATIAAGMIHDVVEDTEYTIEDIRAEFGDEVADLVDGVTKLGAVHFNSKEEQQVDYFRKMLLSMARDVRVILIKLADRVHNMRTLHHLPVEKQRRIALETREVYCALAHRFGINKAKIELEDLSLKYLEPEVYLELVERVQERKEEREAYIHKVVKPLKEALAGDNIIASVNGRAKHLDSIHRKVVVRKVPFDEIYDLFAIRVLVNNERECYHALGIIHSMWKPVTGRFHDYIANPKPNGYKSLHTTVFGPENKRVEIQIRTHQMHYVAENGIAAHWLYKEGRQQMSKDDRQMSWLRDILEWQKDTTNPSEFLEYLKIDLYSEDIFVFTPNGRLVHLPRGATPLDFAFQIHTEVGIHCAGAKINGRLQPLSTRLNSGDRVEIITNPNRTPSHDWLKMVASSTARTRIKRWLKLAGFEQSLALGKEMLERKLKELRLPYPSDDALQEYAEHLDRKTADNLLAGIGNGSVSLQSLITQIQPEEKKEQTGLVSKVIDRIRRSKGIKVQGLDNMMFRFAGCCQPVPGDSIVGFITRGRGVTIHQAECPSAIDLNNQFPERRIEVSWDTSRDQSFVVQLEMLVEDRKNMLRDVSQAIADANTNVRGAEMYAHDTTATGKFVIEVTSLTHLNRVIDKVRKVKGVLSVKRAHTHEQIPEETDDDVD